MQGYVIGLVALDFILRFVRRSMMYVAFIIDVSSMHFNYFSAYTPGFRIPAHVIANLERLAHLKRFLNYPQRRHGRGTPNLHLSTH
jgi:hypothetical protein